MIEAAYIIWRMTILFCIKSQKLNIDVVALKTWRKQMELRIQRQQDRKDENNEGI